MAKNEQKIFGQNIRRLRMAKELSQEALAELCTLDRTYVGAIERGERNVSLQNIVKLARSLGVLPSKLLEGIR